MSSHHWPNLIEINVLEKISSDLETLMEPQDISAFVVFQSTYDVLPGSEQAVPAP